MAQDPKGRRPSTWSDAFGLVLDLIAAIIGAIF